MTPPRANTLSIGLVVGAWLAALGALFWWQARYETTAGPITPTPDQWPEHLAVARAPGRPTLIVGLHPRCPCSSASVDQIAELLARRPDVFDLIVIAGVPPDAGPDWLESDLLNECRRLPHSHIVIDPDGRSLARLGLRTSGHVLAYDGHGVQVFSGGVTSGRGHAGPSVGLHVLMSHDETRPSPPLVQTPVYGCELVLPIDTASVAAGVAR